MEPEVLWLQVTRTRHWSLYAASISAPHTHTHTHTHTHARALPVESDINEHGLLEKLIIVRTIWNSSSHGPKCSASCSQEPRDIQGRYSNLSRHFKCYFILTPRRNLEFKGKNNGIKAILLKRIHCVQQIRKTDLHIKGYTENNMSKTYQIRLSRYLTTSILSLPL